jgi:hypothetical protein
MSIHDTVEDKVKSEATCPKCYGVNMYQEKAQLQDPNGRYHEIDIAGKDIRWEFNCQRIILADIWLVAGYHEKLGYIIRFRSTRTCANCGFEWDVTSPTHYVVGKDRTSLEEYCKNSGLHWTDPTP